MKSSAQSYLGGQGRLGKRSIPLEKIGIESCVLTPEDLEEIATYATEELLKSLKSVFVGKEDYVACVNLRRLADGSVTAEVIVEPVWEGPTTPEREALIDAALQKALKVVRDELKRKCGGG